MLHSTTKSLYKRLLGEFSEIAKIDSAENIFSQSYAAHHIQQMVEDNVVGQEHVGEEKAETETVTGDDLLVDIYDVAEQKNLTKRVNLLLLATNKVLIKWFAYFSLLSKVLLC